MAAGVLLKIVFTVFICTMKILVYVDYFLVFGSENYVFVND